MITRRGTMIHVTTAYHLFEVDPMLSKGQYGVSKVNQLPMNITIVLTI